MTSPLLKPEPPGLFSIAGGHCSGFKVPFTGIVCGFMSPWQGCVCCWCICFDRAVQKYFISRGLMHVWAVTMHLAAIASTENVGLLGWMQSVAWEKSRFPSNVTDKVRRSFRALQLVWIRIVFIKWNLCMRKGLCWSLIHDLSMTPLISRRAQHIGYKTHSLHVHYQDSCVLITISYITHLSCSAVVHTQSLKNTSGKLGLSFSV